MACDGAGFPASEPVRSCGASIKGPPERRSLAPRGLFGRRKVACLASDAPCRTLLPVIEPQSKRAPEPLPPPPRQRLRLSRPEAPGRPASRYRRPPARTPRLREKPARTSVPLASPRLRSARRPRALRPEARNGACQHCNPLRSASTAWDRLSPGGASSWEKAETRIPQCREVTLAVVKLPSPDVVIRVESPLSRRSSRGLRIRDPRHRLSPSRAPSAAISRAGAVQTPIQHLP